MFPQFTENGVSRLPETQQATLEYARHRNERFEKMAFYLLLIVPTAGIAITARNQCC